MNIEEILKEAILLERRGKAFYERVAATTESEAARAVFSTMADEEAKHIDALSVAFSGMVGGEGGDFSVPSLAPARIADSILTDRVKDEVEAAGYEAAAIYAAMGMEERAIAFYTEQAGKAEGKVKELFAWLADWERGHLDLLQGLNEDLRQRVWQDQHFWPF